MLEHAENFQLEVKYEQIWNKIRYKKVDDIYEFTNEVINILENHIDDKLLFHGDYKKIQNLFTKMKQKNFFYNSSSAKALINSINLEFEDVYTKKVCERTLKYIGSDNKDKDFKRNTIYKSSHFNGATYTFNIKGHKRVLGYTYFERIT